MKYLHINGKKVLRSATICFASCLFVLSLSCDQDEVFKKEQYKNVFALISESSNISLKYHDLGKESIGYVAASMGGTNPTTKDITVNLVEDPALIDKFNLINFDVDRSKYTQALPKEKYNIESLQFIIKAGEISGRLPIRIRPDGLSPDSSYFIPLRVETFNAYELNPEKSYVLYAVKTKNQWAISDGNTIYNMRAKLKLKGTEIEINLPGTKVMQPIAKNKVRIVAGNEKYERSVKVFRSSTIVLEIDDDNRVTISPYGSIQVKQIDGDKDYPNIFKIENDGFYTYKTFLLHYEYRGADKVMYEIKEELRMEFDPKSEDEI